MQQVRLKLEEELSPETTSNKESFKEVFNFDNFKLMMDRISQQQEENESFKSEIE